MLITRFYSLSLILPLLCAAPLRSYGETTPWNVILITVDGVRYQEFFSRDGHTGRLPGMNRPQCGFPKLWEQAKRNDANERLWIFGDLARDEVMRIANPYAISLPGYQAIFTGESQGEKCKNNSCPPVTVETFPERLIREAKLSRENVASISSWTVIAKAIESKPGTVLGNYGNQEILEPEMASVNRAQKANPSRWAPARYDQYTGDYALWFLKTKQPRFLHIGFNDSDEYGHEGKYKKYLGSLNYYDSFFQEVIQTLKMSGEYGRRTAVILTTDHGRGRLFFWKDHSREYRSAHRIFGVLRMPDAYPATVKRRTGSEFSQSDLRPTIEAFFGLPPLPNASGKKWFQE